MRSRGRIVGGPQAFGWGFILLTVVHATRGKVLSSLDIATSRSLPTPTATEEGDCSKNDVSEAHYANGSDESNDETFVVTGFFRVEIALHVSFVDGGVAAGSAVGAGVGAGPAWDVLLELVSGLA